LIDPLQIPSFETRLLLIAKQIHRYRHMYELDPKVAQMASDLLAELSPSSAAPVSPAPPSVAAVAAPSSLQPPVRRGPVDPSSWGRVGRNEPCPCGSGKKYKQCHGALA
jgi:preprotein translocase subunit SecA